MTRTVAVIGLGAMGLPMATRLAERFEVRGFDIATERLALADAQGVAFEQHCRYPEGNLVVCVTVAAVRDGRITRQTVAQSWD